MTDTWPPEGPLDTGPDEARRLLGLAATRYITNHLSGRLVTAYAAAILEGRQPFDNTPLTLSADNRLIHGLNRLTAIAMTGTRHTFTVTRISVAAARLPRHIGDRLCDTGDARPLPPPLGVLSAGGALPAIPVPAEPYAWPRELTTGMQSATRLSSSTVTDLLEHAADVALDAAWVKEQPPVITGWLVAASAAYHEAAAHLTEKDQDPEYCTDEQALAVIRVADSCAAIGGLAHLRAELAVQHLHNDPAPRPAWQGNRDV